VGSENGGPDGFFGVRKMRDDPKAGAWVEENGDALELAGRDRPGGAEEVDGVILVEASSEGESEMEIEESGRRRRLEEGAFFALGFEPGGIWSGRDGADMMRGVVAGQEGGEACVGGSKGTDFFVAEDGGEAILEVAKAALDFAFGLGIWSDAMIDAQAEESALELAARLSFGLGAGRTKEAQSIGVDGGWKTKEFEGRAEVAKVVPGGVGGDQTSGDNFAGVIVLGENEDLFLAAWPPRVEGTVMLPEFADVGALPAAALTRLGRGDFQQVG